MNSGCWGFWREGWGVGSAFVKARFTLWDNHIKTTMNELEMALLCDYAYKTPLS